MIYLLALCRARVALARSLGKHAKRYTTKVFMCMQAVVRCAHINPCRFHNLGLLAQIKVLQGGEGADAAVGHARQAVIGLLRASARPLVEVRTALRAQPSAILSAQGHERGLHKKRGDYVHKGESLATFYGAADKFDAAAAEYRSGLVYGPEKPEEAPLVYALVTKDGVERY